MTDDTKRDHDTDVTPDTEADTDPATATEPREIGGRNGPEPTRYGDWEVGGLASDF